MATFLFRNSKPLARPKGPNTSSCEIELGAALKSRKIVFQKKLRLVSQKDIQLVGPLDQYLDVDDPMEPDPRPKKRGEAQSNKISKSGGHPAIFIHEIGRLAALRTLLVHLFLNVSS